MTDPHFEPPPPRFPAPDFRALFESAPEASLREAYILLRAVTDGITDAVFVKDLRGRYLMINPAGAAFLGRSVADVLGRDDTELFSPETAAKIIEDDRRVLAEKTTRTYEEVGASAGLTRTYLSTKGPYRDAEGNVIGLVGIARDITEHKQAVERLAIQYAVTRELSLAGTSTDALPKILEALCRSLDWQWSALWTIAAPGNVLRCAETWCSPSSHLETFEQVSRQMHFTPGVGLPGRVWASGDPAWIPDVQQDGNFPRRAVAVDVGLHSAFGFPISVAGRVLGVMEFFSPEIRQLDDEILRLLATIGGQIGQFIYRKQAEEALVESEARKRAILETALDCIITIDQEGKVVEWNPAAEKTFGYPRAAALGQAMADLIIPPSFRDAHRRGLAHFLASGQGPALGKRLELPALRSDGSIFPAELTIVPIRLAERLLFTGYLREITERQRAEAEIRAQREWLRVTLSSIGDAVIATDTAGQVMFMNPSAELLTGWKQGEASGRSLTEVFHVINEQTREPVENPVSKVLREGSMQGLASQAVLIAKQGGERPIADCAAPIRDQAGGTHGVVLIFHDVSAQRELERQLRERAEKLADAHRRKDEFLTMLAHELRNPLAPIRNALHILRLRGSDPEQLEHVRALMERQVQHLGRLVEDLLDVSRITRGKITLRRERLDWARLVRLGVEDRRSTLEAAGVQLTLEVPETPVWVTADPTRLAQILDNLLENAMKFTEGTGRVTVQLDVSPQEQEAVLTVSDTGVGIAPEILPRLFEPFVQADRSLDRSRGGLGLGLALVKGLVALHGGRVTAHSEGLGRGARFTVGLPREKELPGLVEEPVSSALPRKPWRVLVVEDNRDSADSLGMLLELCGYEVMVAYTGPAGVEAAVRARPDIVLCDIGLPGMDGFAVARAIRQNAATATARLIAVTGYGQEEDRQRAFQAGFDEHLVKPVDLEELLGNLETVLPQGGAPHNAPSW